MTRDSLRIFEMFFLYHGRHRISITAMVLLLTGLVTLPSSAQRRQLESAAEQQRRALGEDKVKSGGTTGDQRGAGEEAPSGDTTSLGVNLSSLQLISHQAEADMSPVPGAVPVVIDPALPAPPGLAAKLEPYVGKPMSMAILADINKDIILAWRTSDYPLVDVYYPEQNITGGRLQIVVREAVLGVKKVEGAKVSKEDYLTGQIGVEPGDRLPSREIESDVDWLNENPIRKVDLIYERGEVDGTSDILLSVDEGKPFTAYMGFANTGVELTGEEEWSFGFNWANPFQQEHMVGYHFATNLDWENLMAHSVFYQAFLPWQHTLRLIGAYVTSSSDDPAITLEGLSAQLTAEYRIPLDRPRFNRQLRHYLTFAFDYKSTNTDLIFGGTGLFGTEVEVGQFRAAYDATLPDKLGVTRLSAGLVASPGNLFDGNDNAGFAASRPGSEADYAYTFAEVERLFRLPQDFTLRLKVSGQATGDRLTATEQLLAGGYASVRGFDESVVRGDSGVITTLEVISPDFSLSPKLSADLDDTWNALVFYDSAALDISDALPGEISPSLQGIGAGLNCRVAERGYARAAYGWALDSRGILPAHETAGRFHFAVTLTY